MANTPEQNKVVLDREFDKVEQKQREVESQKFITSNNVTEAKSKLVKEMFSIMEGMGVDMSNLESISAFLQQLQQIDPDLHELFEFGFNNLTKDGAQGQQPQPQPTEGAPNLMDKFKNLSGGMMRGNQQNEEIQKGIPGPPNVGQIPKVL